jgi:hypothetical protein
MSFGFKRKNALDVVSPFFFGVRDLRPNGVYRVYHLKSNPTAITYYGTKIYIRSRYIPV